LGTGGLKKTLEKAARNWQDEAAVVDHKLREWTTTLTLLVFLFCNIYKPDIIRKEYLIWLQMFAAPIVPSIKISQHLPE